MPSPEPLVSAAPPNDLQASPVGAGVAEAIEDHYISHYHLLKWIEETKQKLPNATPLIRREAFLADPLLKGTIFPYLKNVLLQGFTVQTKDNKLYSAAIEEIKDYLDSLGLMEVFREDFLSFAILDGHSYRRMDPDQQGNVARLEKIESSSVVTYNDPWDSSITAYHQRAAVKTSWSTNGVTTQFDSWFIPFGKDLSDINATFIMGRGIGNDLRVFDLFETYKAKYSITDIVNLRIAASERIVAMHNTEITSTNTYTTTNTYDRFGTETSIPAPIDTVLLAIWLKRLLLTNAPNLIYVVLSPFLHLISGILKESKDALGNPIIVSSVPKKPHTGMQTTNPVAYNDMLANHTAWVESLDKAGREVINSLKNGGVFVSGPDLAIKPIESSRSISFQLVKSLIDQLNEEIGQAFGFPIALVRATGAELASSRNILQMFNTVHAGERTEYETVANKLIRMKFSDWTWQGSTVENEVEKFFTYSFDDIKVKFELDTPDTKDLLQEAQAYKTSAETLTILKTAGASKDDVQALGDEYGFGLLGLDNYQASSESPEPAQINAILKSCLAEVLIEGGLISASPTAPSGFQEKEVVKKLQEAYQVAQDTIDELFEEN